jgi:metal-responsive CopG/Arc/MetJ family transcriptional regulator
MTNNLGSSDQSTPKDISEQKVAIKIQLPMSLAKAIKQRASRLGQNHNEVILEALQHLLEQDEPSQLASSQFVTVEALTELAARVSALEAISSRMEDLEGKWIAS